MHKLHSAVTSSLPCFSRCTALFCTPPWVEMKPHQRCWWRCHPESWQDPRGCSHHPGSWGKRGQISVHEHTQSKKWSTDARLNEELRRAASPAVGGVIGKAYLKSRQNSSLQTGSGPSALLVWNVKLWKFTSAKGWSWFCSNNAKYLSFPNQHISKCSKLKKGGEKIISSKDTNSHI